MDELTKGIQDELPWYFLFTYDIVLIDETSEGANGKLGKWRHTLESRDFRISRSTTEYFYGCFSGKEDVRG